MFNGYIRMQIHHEDVMIPELVCNFMKKDGYGYGGVDVGVSIGGCGIGIWFRFGKENVWRERSRIKTVWRRRTNKSRELKEEQDDFGREEDDVVAGREDSEEDDVVEEDTMLVGNRIMWDLVRE
ncbi:hypothetical protein RIF29_27056 [Crotalaria pallida]|uniref:Uncharacterized protein n=1 Tax=Crotalaria pallida TaxID=3830 RepID=A0AAN9END8_CROPI